MKRTGMVFLVIASLYFLGFPDISMGAKTFKCTGGSFKDSVKLNKGQVDGQCVKYVRYEIADNEDYYEACNGNAWTCYDDALKAGYAVGQKPRESAIIVFDADLSKPGLEVGHVGLIRAVNDNMVTMRDSNWVEDFTVGEHTEDVSKFKIKGYIYCDGKNGDDSHDATVPTQGNYAWTKVSGESCQDGTNHYLLDRFGLAIPIQKDNACWEVSQICSNSSLRRKSKRSIKLFSLSSNPFIDDFWSSVRKAVSNSAHDLFGADPAKACEDHIVYRTIRIKDSGEAEVVSDTKSDIKVFYPQSANLTAPVTKPDSLPNLQIQKMEVFDEDYLLTEERSYMEPGETYQIHVWPVSQKEDCKTGIKKGKDTVETDTFWKIKDSPDGWKFLGRSYTKCEHLVEDDSKKEVLSFTVPEEAAGKKIYFKSKVDSTGEVTETNEHDNWSDTEWYPADVGVHYPDITLTDFSLTRGRTSLSLGDRFGVRTVVANQGNAPAVENVRLIYSLWPPNANDWADQTDDKVTRNQMCAGCSKEELTQDEPFDVNQLGTWGAKVCASFQPQELNFNNNCWWFYFEVTDGPVKLPDYFTADASLTRGKTSLKLGDHFGIRGVSTNIGNANSQEDTRLGYYTMRPGSGEWKLRDSDKVSAEQMCVGCSKEEWTKDDPFIADAIGVWQGLVCASYQYQTQEFLYDNNCLEFFFEVKPDFSFEWSFAGTISGNVKKKIKSNPTHAIIFDPAP